MFPKLIVAATPITASSFLTTTPDPSAVIPVKPPPSPVNLVADKLPVVGLNLIRLEVLRVLIPVSVALLENIIKDSVSVVSLRRSIDAPSPRSVSPTHTFLKNVTGSLKYVT